jgi:SAM-dependent MidA family methyltransferase
VNELQQIILGEISANGPVSCARFMELALYHPVHGYYEKRLDQVGRAGDFQTSVSVGPLFGELLARRFAGWLEPLALSGASVRIVETGAHQGQLAADILLWLKQHRPALADRLRYCILEPSERRRDHQGEFLAAVSKQVDWFPGIGALEAAIGGVHGIFFSNELLDAFPIHRFAWSSRQRAWAELGVGARADELQWTPLTSPTADLPPVPEAALASILPDAFTVESSPAAVDWWRRAGNALREGYLVAFDYGLETDEGLDPSRPKGTLRGYRNHSHAHNVLTDPGEQDLTAHVHWKAIRQAGEAVGLHTRSFSTQGTFLTKLLQDLLASNPDSSHLDPKQIRQFQTLTHPQHFGSRFQVLVQSRHAE